MLHNEMIEKLKNDSIKNEELLDCLNSKNFNIVGQAIYKIMERGYFHQIFNNLDSNEKYLVDNFIKNMQESFYNVDK